MDYDTKNDADITCFVTFGDNDSESLPLTQCACGQKFPMWEFILSVYRDLPRKCGSCGRRLYFRNSIRVYEVRDDVDLD